MKNSHIILRIVLPILTKLLQKSQLREGIFQEVAKQSAEYLARPLFTSTLSSFGIIKISKKLQRN